MLIVLSQIQCTEFVRPSDHHSHKRQLKADLNSTQLEPVLSRGVNGNRLTVVGPIALR
jgi:hypothetical protein